MKKTMVIITIVFLTIQFIRIDKENPPVNKAQEYAVQTHAPLEVAKIIKKACYDCHSNEVNYPWYSNVAPISWFIKEHVNQGREYVNFSEFGKYNQYQKEHINLVLPQVLERNTMPLHSYVWLHKEAELSEKERKTLLNWFITIIPTKNKN